MNNLAQRLRIDATAGLVPDIVRADCQEAADRIRELEADNEALRHDLSKSMANHMADINGAQSETKTGGGFYACGCERQMIQDDPPVVRATCRDHRAIARDAFTAETSGVKP